MLGHSPRSPIRRRPSSLGTIKKQKKSGRGFDGSALPHGPRRIRRIEEKTRPFCGFREASIDGPPPPPPPPPPALHRSSCGGPPFLIGSSSCRTAPATGDGSNGKERSADDSGSGSSSTSDQLDGHRNSLERNGTAHNNTLHLERRVSQSIYRIHHLENLRIAKDAIAIRYSMNVGHFQQQWPSESIAICSCSFCYRSTFRACTAIEAAPEAPIAPSNQPNRPFDVDSRRSPFIRGSPLNTGRLKTGRVPRLAT